MCVVSMVAEHYKDMWWPDEIQPKWPEFYPPVPVSRKEFERLKSEVEKMLRLMGYAKEIDEATGQPDCEKPELIELLRKMAAVVGKKLED